MSRQAEFAIGISGTGVACPNWTFAASPATFRTVNIAFDKHQEAFIQHKLEAGGYRNASEVVREAMRLLEAQDELPSTELEAALLKGLKSGPARPLPPDYWEKLRSRAAAKLRKPRRRAA